MLSVKSYENPKVLNYAKKVNTGVEDIICISTHIWI
jgi:hypothetical protein